MGQSSSDYKGRAKRLRELKLLPSHYKLSNLTESQKRHIRRLEQQYRNVVDHDYFKPVYVPEYARQNLKQKGIPTKKGKRNIAFFESWNAEEVYFDPADDSIHFIMPGREYTAYPLDNSFEQYQRIDEFFDNLKPGQYLTFKIGNNNTFHRQIRTMADFMKYKDHEFQPKHDTAWDYLMIVEVTRDSAQAARDIKSGRKFTRAKTNGKGKKNNRI